VEFDNVIQMRFSLFIIYRIAIVTAFANIALLFF